MTPRKPRLVFRVGIVGHRPHRLTSADPAVLAERLGEILSRVRAEVGRFGIEHSDLFASDPPRLRAVSPLAEGADRVFAEAALRLGYELCCPLPFPREEFEKDFTPPAAHETNSVESFRALLRRAAEGTGLTTFELDGDRAVASKAYAVCGQVVLNQSDLLVAVWDGARLGKLGGTERLLDQAADRGIPVVIVDARAPHECRVVPGAVPRADALAAPRTIRTVEEVVRDGLGVPIPRNRGDGEFESTLALFLQERQRRVNIAPWWSLFRALMTKGIRSMSGVRVPDYEQAVTDEWPRNRSTPHACVIDALRPFYAWPDRLAVVYSDLYRSAFVMSYLLAALAVGVALLPLALGWNVYEPHASEAALVLAELALMICILLLLREGRRRGWHQRWLDYRLTAELVRHLRLSAPLGISRPFPQVPAQWASYGDAGSTWMSWYVRAVEREIGLPAARLDRDHLLAATDDVRSSIRRQLEFHTKSRGVNHAIEHRLHRAGVLLFIATAVACAAHFTLALGVVATPPWAVGSLIFFAGFFPVLGASLVGITNQGEFKRVSMRSQAMVERLTDLDRRANELLCDLRRQADTPPGASAKVRELATEAAQLMVNEVLDWRVVFLDRPLREP